MLNLSKVYSYPGLDDANFNRRLESIEPYKGYWYQSEEYVFFYVDRLLRSMKGEKLLDVGCGEGRLLQRFSKYFKNIYAIDPDQKRVDLGKTSAKKMNIRNVHFLCGWLEEHRFNEGSFDVVLLSHVVEHINTKAMKDLLSEVHRILNTNGLLILTTAHSRKPVDRFQSVSSRNERVEVKNLTQEQFDAINEEGTLPIHFFSIRTLRDLLSEQFEVVEVKVYHVMAFLPFVDRFIFRDRVANYPLLRTFLGRDVMFLVRKREK
jgi:2-polyprenyl-3-methyl-5-hydroxy-6-metoxy-1,4-benzoquinol methylase